MARRTVFDCDGCGKKDVQTGPINLVVGFQCGALELEERYEHLDFCASCLAVRLERLLHTADRFDDQYRLLWVKANKKS